MYYYKSTEYAARHFLFATAYILLNAMMYIDLMYRRQTKRSVNRALAKFNEATVSYFQAIRSELPPIFTIRMIIFCARRKWNVKRHDIFEA